jgi:hypothetical protein
MASVDHNGELVTIDAALPIVVDDHPVGTAISYGSTVYYKMMGRDSACPTKTYHVWVVQNSPDFTGSSAGTLPCGGPLVDICILDTWI